MGQNDFNDDVKIDPDEIRSVEGRATEMVKRVDFDGEVTNDELTTGYKNGAMLQRRPWRR